jgi:hypothetical protein
VRNDVTGPTLVESQTDRIEIEPQRHWGAGRHYGGKVQAQVLSAASFYPQTNRGCISA